MNKKITWIAACVIVAALYGLVPAVSSDAGSGRHWTSTLAALYRKASAQAAEAHSAAQPLPSGRPETGSWPNPDTGLRPAAPARPTAAPGGSAERAPQTARADKPQPGTGAALTAALPAGSAGSAAAAVVQAAAAPVKAAAQQPSPSAAPAAAGADPARAAAGAGEPAATALDSAVEGWKAALSQERGFESWQKAVWNSYPLGPGTHGWVVLLYNEGKEVGYMVVHAADPGGFRLTEYGTGDSPLFSYATLYRSLVQQELIPRELSYAGFINSKAINKQRLYYHALAALWKIAVNGQTYFLDAKTGELLPLTADPAEEAQTAAPQATKAGGSVDERLLPSFDPYDRLPWVEGKPLAIAGLPELKAALNRSPRLTYVAELYQGHVTVPLAVTGYRKAGANEPYLVLDQVGPRYIRLQDALDKGGFYP